MPRRSIRRMVASFVLFALFAGGAAAQDESAGPRPGKYRILSYGAVSQPPLVLGSFVLSADGKYQAFLVGGKPAGEGAYAYDAAKKTVVWKTGPYVDQWGGEFSIDREGKTHKIRLKRTTIGVNSTDSAN